MMVGIIKVIQLLYFINWVLSLFVWIILDVKKVKHEIL